jgi:hypothetical protein
MHSFFTFIFCLLSIPALAQYEERPATLTNRNDETISGLVNYYDWDKSPEAVEFLTENTHSLQTIPIKYIQRLTLKDGPVYEGLYLKIPYYAKAPVTISADVIDHIDSTYYLSELILDSQSIKLYRFFDTDARVRFVVAKYDSLVLLNDIHVSLHKRESVYAYQDPVYRKQLKAILNECPTLNTEHSLYSENSLISLLKDYLSFCRIDSKVYLEQKKLGKPLIGVGTFGSFWKTSDGKSTGYGLSFQLLLPRRHHNIFTLIDIGKFNRNTDLGAETAWQFGIYGGQHFGRHAVQARLYTGLSTLFGPLDTGVGLSYRKVISAEMRYPIFYGLLSGFREKDSYYYRPLINLRAIVPLSSADRH